MPPIYVVMGVSGCGKSTVGGLLAAALQVAYLEGDDFHSPRNVELMAAGIALTDADRADWLLRLRDVLADAVAARRGAVLACSALKRSYRDVLRAGAPKLQLVYLRGSRELLATRLSARRDHYMPAALLDSQLATLQPPQADENAWAFDIAQSPEQIVQAILAQQAST